MAVRYTAIPLSNGIHGDHDNWPPDWTLVFRVFHLASRLRLRRSDSRYFLGRDGEHSPQISRAVH